jgi:hypothetical protein
MKAVVIDLLAEVAELVASQRPLRRSTANGKVQIRDKQTGKVYPSKNNTYRSMLKAGELKELVDQGIFGQAATISYRNKYSKDGITGRSSLRQPPGIVP